MRLAIIVTASALALTASAAAQSGSVLTRQIGVDLSAGTTGISGHVQYGLHERVALRAGANWLDVSPGDIERGDIEYEGDVELAGVSAFVDVHPFANAFTLTGGVFVGDKEVALLATPQEDVTLGDQTFTPDQVGTLTGEGSFSDTAFFAGLGYDGVLYKKSRLSLVARAGVMFVGDPDVTLNASEIAQDPTGELRAALDAEERELEDEIGDYGYYPVVTIGLGYGF